MAFPASAKTMAYIMTSDRQRAKAFYGDVLGFRLTGENPAASMFDLNGVMLTVVTAGQHVASPHPVLGWEVPDITAAISTLRDKGVTFTIYDGFGQDEDGVWTAPNSGARIAWFPDPDGNVLSLTQL